MWAEDRGRLAACGTGRGVAARATFWDVRERSRAVAGALAAQGVHAGSGVAIVAPLGLELAVAFVGVIRLGAVAIVLDAATPTAAQKRRIAAAKPAGVVATAALARTLGRPGVRARLAIGGEVPGWLDADAASAPARAARPKCSSADAAVAFAADASGLARFSHAWVFAQRFVGEFWLDLRRTDLHGAAVAAADPLGLSTAMLAPWSVGTAVAWRQARGSAADWLVSAPISTIAAAPLEFAALAAGKFGVPEHLRHCTATGAVASAAAEAWRRATGLAIHTGFGCGRAPLLAAHLRGLPVRAGSIGRPFPGHDVVVDDGELVVRGGPPTLALGSRSKDGIYRTGVRARSDEQGYLWIVETLA